MITKKSLGICASTPGCQDKNNGRLTQCQLAFKLPWRRRPGSSRAWSGGDSDALKVNLEFGSFTSNLKTAAVGFEVSTSKSAVGTN